MIKSMIGPVTAYADAVKAGYTGTREEFARQQANFAQNAASVEASKLEIKQTVAEFSQTAETAKQDITAEGDRQIQRIADAAPDLELDREQIASNTAAIEDVLDIAMDARTIAKGRATGYVFDTVEDMQAWLTVEENTQNLVLGDNLYIRSTDVPDYWWDGVQAQKLETQKVDLSEYVKNTDYAGFDKAGILSIYSGCSLRMTNDNKLIFDSRPSSDSVRKKANTFYAITPSNLDYSSVQSAHQEMSNDYDPATALTPDGNVPYAYGDRQPVSYAAVKGYVDGRDDWENEPKLQIILEEDVTSINISNIDGKRLDFSELIVTIKCYANDLLNPGSVCLSLNGYEGYYEHISTPYTAKGRNDSLAYMFHVCKRCGVWVFEASISANDIQYSNTILKNIRNLTDRHTTYYKDESINKITLKYGVDATSFKAGTEISIYGKPAQKGATT